MRVTEAEPSYLCHFLKVFVPFLQSSGSVEGLSYSCVFAEEGLAVVFYPVQYLCRDTTRPQSETDTRNEATTRGRSKAVDESCVDDNHKSV